MSAVEFRSRIRASIANGQLQSALDANAQRRAMGREAAFGSLPDWPDRRRRAHAVRAEVMERLHELLDSFAERASGNGMRVHRAEDAAGAIRMVLEIAEASRRPVNTAGRSRPLLFAKSKSMVSEEIELNAALQGRGHRVVETDLGEFIVQLRGEKPAHIITPAVHLKRQQVGELFRDKLGLPYTDDIPTLTSAARRALREVFLTADVGVSGVNFGVAETGGICIVTNEGNGRMVTTVPRVHIALMGMERLVPTLDDLALMLSLLPRSATGQKLSVYTQLIHSPRREGEADGALERHVIIVDNGRSRLWASGLQEALYCIRCGACLNACPVFREIGGHAYVAADGAPAPYPGPIGSVVSPGLEGLPQFGHLAQASSLCGACKDACPVDIDLPTLLTRVRAGAPEAGTADEGIGLSTATRVALQTYAVIAASPRLFRFMQGLGAVGGRFLSPAAEWMRLPAFTGWGQGRSLRRPAARPFRDRWAGGGSAVDEWNPGETRTPGIDEGRGEVPEERGKKNEGDTAAVDRMTEELKALGAEVEQVQRSELHLRLVDLLHSRSIDSVLAWEEIDGLDSAQLSESGVRIVGSMDSSLRVGITGCACAIAETGTLVLTSSHGQPLSASLLPEVHVAVVHKSQIVWSLEETLRMPQVREAAAAVLITGPSRTADIEMTLTIGVHGPGELIVYIVE
ncbi:MAG: LUD domain-containing protein [Chloroflexota bacterium]